ncbi:GNAT family N-acetyltransferase [Brevibacterium sp. JNUCC-42]|nr:GNAT family N-acetyltransferase [Brevibacterium sp. JNUCC-42]
MPTHCSFHWYKSTASCYQHYVLYVAGEPASTACMILHKDTVMLENVATLPRFRGKGLIRHLIVYMQRDLLERGVHILFVSPITEQVERVYERCGFQTLGAKVKSGHAFRGGKSIAEVRDQP